MPAKPPAPTIDEHFAKKDPATRSLYDRLVARLEKFGEFEQEPKKTSIHLARSSTIVEIRVRREYLLLTIPSDREITSPRIRVCERSSAQRFELEVRFGAPEELDGELVGWLERAFELSE